MGAWTRGLRGLTDLARLSFWLVLLYLTVQMVLAPFMLSKQRASAIKDLERELAALQKERKSRVIVMIQRQELLTLLGIPISRYITIDDSEKVLRAIRSTPKDTPIDVVLHTPGGMVLAVRQIAQALADHPARVTAFIPHYAMSGGTLIALAADRIVMDPHAVLGPLDPQINNIPAVSLLKVLKSKSMDSIDDTTVMFADMAEKAQKQVYDFLYELLLKHYAEEKARDLAKALSDGRWTHDFPITVSLARKLGIPISTEMPEKVYKLMELYPQPAVGRPSVIYEGENPSTTPD